MRKLAIWLILAASLKATAIPTIAVGDLVIATSNGVATLSLQLESTDDLTSGVWSNIGERVVWEVPTTDSAFFRVQAGENIMSKPNYLF
jgi:hypothetical protein